MTSVPAATADSGFRPAPPRGAEADGGVWSVRERAMAWVLGLVTALVVVGPGLGAGSWFNVDLVVTPVTPVPRGVWGLGPEFPRRVPYALPLAWASTVIDATWATKAMVVVAIAAGVAGAWWLTSRWVPDAPLPVRVGSGLLYGASPFVISRLGVGHLPLVVAFGILPWVTPALLDPVRHQARSFLGALALAATGFFGGTLAVPLFLAGVLGTPASGRRRIRALGLLLVSQGVWLVPGLAVLAQGASPAPSSDFRTDASGAGGVVRLLAGHGFWRVPDQVGNQQGWIVPVLGLALVALAAYGWRSLPEGVRRPAAIAAAVGLFVPMASALPGVRRLYAAIIDTPVSAALREGQRVLPLFLVVLVPAVAAGATRLAHRVPGWREGVVVMAPAAASLVLAGPGLWGVGGSLAPVRLPPDWVQVRAAVVATPGSVLSLPFAQYTPLGIADERLTLDPMPLFLGGDVLSSSDPGLSDASVERLDRREQRASRVVASTKEGTAPSADLARLGVRWVVLRHDADWTRYRATLADDTGLRRVVRGTEIDLWEVRDWPGTLVGPDGVAGSIRQPVSPLGLVDGDDAATWNRPAARGWMRGRHTAGTTPQGTVALPAAPGPVWFWPTIPVIGAYLTALGVAAVAFRRRTRHVDGS